MPELDVTSIVAIASFAALVLAWLVAPSGSASAVADTLPAAA